jgi:MFS family permease
MRLPSLNLRAFITGFASLGVVGSVLMTRQPEFQSLWSLDAAEWGWVLFTVGLGGVLSFPVNRWFLARIGSRAMIGRFGIAGGLVMAAIPWLPGLNGLLAGMFLQGMIYNGVSVAVNQQAAEWELRERRRMMGRLHATFYVGSMLSAFVSGGLAASGLPLSIHMGVVGALAAALHVWVSRALPAERPGGDNPSSAPIPAGAWQGLAVLAICHGVVESGIMGWSAIYLHQGLRASESLAGMALAVFAGTMALGRFLTDAVVTWLGPVPVIAGGSVLCGLGLVLAVVLGSPLGMLVGLAACGFGLAAVAPVFFSAAGRLGGQTLALIASFNAIGGLIGPPVLGQVAKLWSLGTVFAVLAAMCVVMAWNARVLRERVADIVQRR